MRNVIITIVTYLVLSPMTFAQVKIIFDTDFGGDADDLGALVMLHNFIDKNECELLAVMSWSTEEYTVPAINAVNRFYNHPDIPIGTRKDSIHHEEWNYSKSITDKFKYELDYYSAADATNLYRKILAQSEDYSIKIVTVGPLKNIENLIRSKGDEYSELTGRKLIEKKVDEFVIMGGQFPAGEKEWNFDGNMAGVTKYVLENLEVPVTFSGFEIGASIKSGEVFNEINPETPLYVGFKHFSKNAPWIKEYFKGEILDNSTFDQTAVLYAVRGGVGQYWEKISGGYCQADENGGNKWIISEPTNHSYLKLIADPEFMAEFIEAIMLNDFK